MAQGEVDWHRGGWFDAKFEVASANRGLRNGRLADPRYDSATGTRNDERMQGPFLVGFSMASGDIWSALAKRREPDFTEAMLKGPLKKGDESYEMFSGSQSPTHSITHSLTGSSTRPPAH